MSEQALGVAEERNARLMTNDGAEGYLIALGLRRFCVRGWGAPQGRGGARVKLHLEYRLSILSRLFQQPRFTVALITHYTRFSGGGYNTSAHIYGKVCLSFGKTMVCEKALYAYAPFLKNDYQVNAHAHE